MSPALLRHVVLPVLFLTTALLGGLRFVGADNEMRFVAPPLASLLLAAFLVVLFARSRLLDVGRDWLGAERPPLENASNALTLGALYFASVQAFNAVIPEDTLFNALFTLFFALVFWNDMFALLRPDRLLKSLGGLMLGSFVVKYVVLVGLAEPAESLAGTVAKAILRGVTLGGLETEPYTRATGYTAFAAVAVYLVGLWGASPPRDERFDAVLDVLAARGRLTEVEGRRVLAALAPAPSNVSAAGSSDTASDDAALDAEIVGEERLP